MQGGFHLYMRLRDVQSVMQAEVDCQRRSKYRYILSVKDHFSHFCWLRPILRKEAKCVYDELAKLFAVEGVSKILQCDNGTEFKGVNKVKCIYVTTKSRLCHDYVHCKT